MKTISMTEFNQHPSRVATLATDGDVIVQRRGKPYLRVSRIDAVEEDRFDDLIRMGLMNPPRKRPDSMTLSVVDTDLDLNAILEADRGRLDD